MKIAEILDPTQAMQPAQPVATVDSNAPAAPSAPVANNINTVKNAMSTPPSASKVSNPTTMLGVRN